MTTTSALAGASGYAPSRAAVPTIVAEYPISPYESFTASLSERLDGRRVCAIGRIKHVGGEVRRSASFEFGEHRAQAIASLIDELLRAIATRSTP